MPMFNISAEHVNERDLDRIRAFCKEKKIRVTKSRMDETFTNFVHVRVSGDSKVVANKVRKFIWDEVNNGAFCKIRRAT